MLYLQKKVAEFLEALRTNSNSLSTYLLPDFLRAGLSFPLFTAFVCKWIKNPFFSKGYPQQPRQLRRPRQETVDLMNETLMSVQSEAAAGVSISRDSRAGPKHTISPPDLNENTIRAISGSKHRLDVSPEDVSLPPTTDTEDDQGSYTER